MRCAARLHAAPASPEIYHPGKGVALVLHTCASSTGRPGRRSARRATAPCRAVLASDYAHAAHHMRQQRRRLGPTSASEPQHVTLARAWRRCCTRASAARAAPGMYSASKPWDNPWDVTLERVWRQCCARAPAARAGPGAGRRPARCAGRRQQTLIYYPDKGMAPVLRTCASSAGRPRRWKASSAVRRPSP